MSLASGAIWGGIAWVLWPSRTTTPPAWGAILASPLIGLTIGTGFRWIHLLPRRGRIFVALVGLYVSATLFGLVVGWTDLLRLQSLGATNIIPSAVILQAVPAVLWGLTFTGYFAFLWPLAYLNHHLLGEYGHARGVTRD